jgi:hypothetical protein
MVPDSETIAGGLDQRVVLAVVNNRLGGTTNSPAFRNLKKQLGQGSLQCPAAENRSIVWCSGLKLETGCVWKQATGKPVPRVSGGYSAGESGR